MRPKRETKRTMRNRKAKEMLPMYSQLKFSSSQFAPVCRLSAALSLKMIA